MRYPPDLLDEIRSRLPVSRVVERRVKLKRAGREYVGLSPFKTERTPSFTVNDQKRFYHCFASGEHGDIFTFLMKTEGLSFAEAVEKLAAEAGVALPAPKPADEGKADREQRLREALEEACRFFEAALVRSEGHAARDYLERRGVQRAEIGTFRLGFAPDSKTSLKAYLSRRGFSLDEMKEAGLLIHGEDIVDPYDRFRGRLMFPIADSKGRVIAFGGRALSADRQPKYLNSPETSLFHKGRTLFNLARAREASRASSSVVVAEGYMDVIALSRAGFKNAVAPLGTAITADQLRLLWTMAPIPILCLDGDLAGRRAAYRALECALPHLEPGRSLQFVFLPEGRDPDDMVSGGAGETLSQLLAKPVPLIDVLWLHEHGGQALVTPEQRASFEERLLALAGRIEHKSLRYHYISALRERLRTLNAPIKGPAREGASSRRPSSGFSVPSRAQASGHRLAGLAAAANSRTSSLLSSPIAQLSLPPEMARETLIISAILRHPWLLDHCLEEISRLDFSDPDCKLIRDRLLDWQHTGDSLDRESLREHLSRAGYAAKVERLEQVASRMPEPHFAPNAASEAVLEGWRHIMMVHNKAGLPPAVREAENDYINEPTCENFSRLRAVVQQDEIASA